jgi:homocysteine S-methyltransferase
MLAEGSVYELLRRHPGITLDPFIAHAGLIYEERSRSVLRSVHAAYLDVAAAAGRPLLMLSDTWRASGTNVAASRYRDRNVNADNVRFLRAIIAGAPIAVTVAGTTGPRGDAYRPEEAPRYDEALRHHAMQIEQLAARADLLLAATLPSFEESRAIAKLMAETELPWMLSFVVRSDGTLLDRTPLDEAVRILDDESRRPAIGYAINCTHASVACTAAGTLSAGTKARILAFQGNTSPLPPEQLDGRDELATETPEAFASGITELRRYLPLQIVGGCCGSAPEHIAALASVI